MVANTQPTKATVYDHFRVIRHCANSKRHILTRIRQRAGRFGMKYKRKRKKTESWRCAIGRLGKGSRMSVRKSYKNRTRFPGRGGQNTVGDTMVKDKAKIWKNRQNR